MNKLKHISLIGPIRPILKWLTATRRRKILSSILASLMVLTSIRFAFFNEPKLAKAAKMEILEDSSSITINVENRYRAVMQKDDTDNFILFYDRGQNDSNPDPTHEFQGPCILETLTYCLRDDDSRVTTVLEVTDSRVHVRVWGKFNDEAGVGYLIDETAAPEVINVTVDYTFTTEGVFVQNETDFRSTGITLDADSGHNGYEWLGVWADVTDAAFDDTGNNFYGDGETETTIAADGEFANTNIYYMMQGAGSNTYQDAFIGIQRAGWYDNEATATQEWNWEEANSGTQDLIAAQDQNYQTAGKHFAKWFFLLMPESEVDAEAEREGLINDHRNPDILSYTTGSEWDDNRFGSMGHYFDGTDDEINAQSGSSIDLNSNFSFETWVRPSAVSGQPFYSMASKSNASPDEGWQLNFIGNSDVSCSIVDGTPLIRDIGTGDSLCATTAFSPGTWYHVAFTNDGTTSRIYVNGVEENSTAHTFTNADTRNLLIGGRSTDGNDFDGVMDEVRIWSDVRTQAEIEDNMFTQIDPASANLAGYWRLNENGGATAWDETSNDNDGSYGGGAPAWGYVPDQYNEAESAYTIEASSNHAEFTIVADDNVSTLANDATIYAGDENFTADSTAGFPDGGGAITYYAYIDGDKFSYTDVDGTVFSGIPITGENAIIDHADNSLVSLTNRHDPSFKIRGYRNNNVPSEAILEGNRLQKDYGFLADIKPASVAYFAQDLVFSATLQGTEVDVGSDLTNSGCSFVGGSPGGRYGYGLECNASSEDATFTSTSNIDYEVGALEFWLQPKSSHSSGTEHTYFNQLSGSDQFRFRHASDNALEFLIHDGTNSFLESVSSVQYSWGLLDWLHIRLEWDDTASTADQQKIFINGVEPSHTDSSGDYDGSLVSPGTTFFLGNSADAGSAHCDCIIDEFNIYDFNGSGDRAQLRQLGEGGSNYNGNEYLTSTDNDYTFDFNDDDANNRGEYVWIGSDSRFTGVNMDLTTDGVGTSLNFDWEYRTATQWAELTVTEQDSGASDWTGDGNFYWTDPGNWFPNSINGSPDLYYIRGHLEGGSYTTDPRESKILTDILLFQYTRYGGDIVTENMTFEIPGWTSGAPPVAHWKFDAGYGTVAFDAMKGHDLTIKDATWQDESMCVSGKCLNYDGSEDQASRSAQLAELDFKETNSFTLTGWFRHGGAGGIDTLLSKYESGGSDGGYKVYVNSPDNLCFGIDDDNSSFPEDSTCSTAVVTDSQWHHFAAVKTDTTQIDLYLDGVRVGYDDNISASGTLENDDGFYMGADEGGNQNYWVGSIDEVKVYRYARSEDEIKADYIGGSQVFGGNTEWISDGLEGYWRFDETALNSCGTNTDACDASRSELDLLARNQATTVSTPGVFGNAATFDGAGDRYCSDSDDNNVCNDMGELDFGGTVDFSISAWFYRDTFNSDDALVAKSNDIGAESGYGVYIDSSADTLNFAVHDGEVSCSWVGTTQFTTSSWNHMTVTFDQDNLTNIRIFVNGENDYASTSCTQSDLESIGSLANGSNFTIGSESTGNRAYFGDIDEVRVYKRVLSPAEAQDLYEWAPGPVGYWKMDEGTGDTAYDSGSGGNNGDLASSGGTCPGAAACPTWENGRFGKALSFDGNDYVDVGNPNDLRLPSAFSVSAWIYPTDLTGGYKDILRKGDSNNRNYDLDIVDSPDQPYVNFTQGVAGWRNSVATTVLSINIWYHLSGTYDGSDLKIYVNGIMENSVYHGGDADDPNDILAIGRAGSVSGSYFIGLIDEVKIYNYARTAEQIIEDMNAGHPAPGSPVGSALGHWRFDEGYGDTVYDSSPQGNNGDLYGSCPGASTCPTWTNAGKFGKALWFDDSNSQYLTVPDDNVFSFGDGSSDNPFSLSLWFNADDITTGDFSTTADFLIAKDNSSGDREWGLALGNTNDLGFNVFDDSAGGNLTRIYDGVNTGSWYHVVATYDGLGDGGGLKIYLNGTEASTTNNSSGSYTAMEPGTQDVTIGNWDAPSSGVEYDGIIDDVKIYNFALTSDQVKVEYNQGKAAVWGATSSNTSGLGSYDAASEYCPPGSTDSCTAPVLEWKFDENTGTSTANDTSGNANSGTMNNFTENDWVPGKEGSALRFDGSSTYVEDSSTPITAYPFTLGAWAKTEATSGNLTIAGLFDDADIDRFQWLIIYPGGGGVAQAISRQNGSGGRTASGTTAVNDGVWHYIAGVFTSATDRKIYVDGVEEGSNTTSAIFEAGIDNAASGRRNTSSQDSYFDGEIDQVRIYNYTRTPAQLAWEYNQGAPYAWYKLDECQGTTAYSTNDPYDSSLDGTITIGGSGSNDAVGTCSDGDSSHAWNNGTTGKRNSSLDFGGTDDYISVADTPFDFDSGPFAISVWIKTNSSGGYIISKTAGFNNSINYHMWMDAGGLILAAVRETGVSRFVASTNTYNDNNWHNLIFSVTTSTLELFIDGVSEDKESHNNAFQTNNQSLEIGAATAFSSYFDGQIDDIRIYNYALTEQQIKGIISEGALRFGPDTGSP